MKLCAADLNLLIRKLLQCGLTLNEIGNLTDEQIIGLVPELILNEGEQAKNKLIAEVVKQWEAQHPDKKGHADFFQDILPLLNQKAVKEHA